MSVLEVDGVKLKAAYGLLAFVAIPRVGQEHAADIPKQRSNGQKFLQSTISVSDDRQLCWDGSCASQTSSP